MANASLKAAFERMWQHINIKIETALSEHSGTPPITTEDEGKFLGVVNGEAAWTEMDPSYGIILTEGVDYGDELPAEAPKGKIFFVRA